MSTHYNRCARLKGSGIRPWVKPISARIEEEKGSNKLLVVRNLGCA